MHPKDVFWMHFDIYLIKTKVELLLVSPISPNEFDGLGPGSRYKPLNFANESKDSLLCIFSVMVEAPANSLG